jgi:hypothetical protein
MTVFPSSVITEFHNGSVWVNVSDYVVSEISGEGGFSTPDPGDFTASLGSSSFDLDNSGGLFTVYGGDSRRGLNTLAGWRKGAKVRHRVIFAGRDKVVWFGFLDDVVSDDGTWGDQRVHVTCLDWIDVSARYPMKRSEILLDKTLADGVASIVSRISVSPEGVDSDPQTSEFPAIFDNVRSKTKALGEIDKLARSELGFVYVLKDGALKVEGATSRKGTIPLSVVPTYPDNALLVAADNALLASVDNAILLDEYGEASLAVTSEKLDLGMRDDYWNDAFIRNYPTKTDTSLHVLFELGTPILIAAGRTIELIGNYTDPEGGNVVNGTNMQTPVANTDFELFANEDGTGTNGTPSGTVSATYYGDVVEYRVKNNSTVPYWLTKLQARGYGIYRTAFIETPLTVTGSANTYGEKSFDLNQTYQPSPYSGKVYGASVLETHHSPKTRITSARYNANLNPSHMLSFMYLDIGSLIKVYDSRSQMFKNYHITSRKFTIFLGGMIIITYGLYEHLSIASGALTPVSIEFASGTSSAVDFGYIPSAFNLTERSISFWVYRETSLSPQIVQVMYGGLTDGEGIAIFTYSDRRHVNVQIKTTGFQGLFRTTDLTLLEWQAWHLVTVTLNTNTLAPQIYVDGVLQANTELLGMTGTFKDETGVSLVWGNEGTNVIPFNLPLAGLLYDARIYSKILTQAEVTELYNSGVPDLSAVTDSMVFQGFSINSDLGDTTSLDGLEIPADNNYFENVSRYVGAPHGSPVIRQAP